MTGKSYFLVTAVVPSVVGLAFVEDRPRVGGGRRRERSIGLSWVATIVTVVLAYHGFPDASRARRRMAGTAFGDLATYRSTRESITQYRVIGSIIEPAQSGRTCLFFDMALSHRREFDTSQAADEPHGIP